MVRKTLTHASLLSINVQFLGFFFVFDPFNKIFLCREKKVLVQMIQVSIRTNVVKYNRYTMLKLIQTRLERKPKLIVCNHGKHT